MTERPTVLAIDDEPAFLALMTRSLSREFSVVTATDAVDGYTLLCQERPDVVLLDVMMPLVDGWTLLKKIRANPDFARTCVIVITGLSREAADHESARLNVHQVLVKPVSPQQLVDAVRNATAGARAAND